MLWQKENSKSECFKVKEVYFSHYLPTIGFLVAVYYIILTELPRVTEASSLCCHLCGASGKGEHCELCTGTSHFNCSHILDTHIT